MIGCSESGSRPRTSSTGSPSTTRGNKVSGVGNLRREGHGEPAFLERMLDLERMEVLVDEGAPRQGPGLLDGCPDAGSFFGCEEFAEGPNAIRYLSGRSAPRRMRTHARRAAVVRRKLSDRSARPTRP